MDKKFIVEIAQFKLAAGVSEKDFLMEADAVQKNFLQKQKGYIDRELLRGDDGQWVDILHWTSMAEATRAAEMMMKDPSTLGFLQSIDPASVKMLHLEQVEVWK